MLKVNESGDAFVDFGAVLHPRTIGFRVRYLGQGSGIANGVSAPKDFHLDTRSVTRLIRCWPRAIVVSPPRS